MVPVLVVVNVLAVNGVVVAGVVHFMVEAWRGCMGTFRPVCTCADAVHVCRCSGQRRPKWCRSAEAAQAGRQDSCSK